MAQPPGYTRQFDFSGFSTTNPEDQQPGVSLDSEFNAIKTTIDATLVDLALIQRDDGQLANQSVGPDQLRSDTFLGLNTAADWVTAHAYIINDAVYQSNKIYRCLVAHTSGVFATDLAAAKWSLVVDFNQYIVLATAQATASAASAAAALVSETNAGTSATDAALSAASLSGTSSTTLTPAVATKVFTTQSGKSFNGQWCLAYSSSVPTVYMHGPCTYSGTTLTMNVDNIGTVTSKSDWVIWVSGTRGATGATGTPGSGSGDMLAANNLSDVAVKATGRTNLGVAIGSNVQAWSGLLDAHAALSASSGTIEKTGAATVGVYTVTAAGKALIDDADASAQRTTLGLGTAAVTNTGTSAGNTVVLNGSAQLPAVDGSLLTGVVASTGIVNTQTFTSSGTWTKPASGSIAVVRAWGAGGSGGARATTGGASGGGGGAYVESIFLLSALGATETVTLGNGGTGVSGNTVGVQGGDTTFGSWLTAYGGGNGGSTANGGGGGGRGGAGSGATNTVITRAVAATYVGVCTAMGSVNGGGSAPYDAYSFTDGGTSTFAKDGFEGGGAGSTPAIGSSGINSFNGGGGGGYGSAAASALAGGTSQNGGGGGGGTASTSGTQAGGTSKSGGNGGAGGSSAGSNGVAGSVPGGGGGAAVQGGTSGAGGKGKVIVLVF